MKIQDPEILKSLEFCINLLFKIVKIAKKRKNHSNIISISYGYE